MNTKAVVLRPGDDDPAMLEKILDAIFRIESRDGPSYGAKMWHVADLQRMGVLGVHFKRKWLNNREQNRYVAKLYLQEMYRQHKCWYKAVQYYSGDGELSRRTYTADVFSRIKED